MTQRSPLLPTDPSDKKLVDAVHPASWSNPVPPARRYHLVVVGAGTGGLVTAAVAAGLGARVALVERSLMGGDCLNVGCVPSKAMLRAARAWSDARSAAARFGAPAVEGGDGDFAMVMARMREVRARLAPVDGAERFRSLGVDVYFGEGRFVADDAVIVGDVRLPFRRAVIATGARATEPDIPGLTKGAYYTNETIFTLTERPAHLVVLGAGPIGCELGQAFAKLGSRVTVIDKGTRVLPADEREASVIVERAMRQDGVELLLGAVVTQVELHGKSSVIHVRQNDMRTLECDALLIAAGRTPNVDGLGLDDAHVSYDARHGVVVDDRLRTSNARIYAVGDVCSAMKFTHLADFQARMVVRNALFYGRNRVGDLVVPWVTYTSPEVAHVGITAADAEQRGIETDVVDVPMHDVDRAVLDDETEGFCRVRLAKGSDRILGVTIVGTHAGEMISEATLAMTAKLKLGAIGGTMHPYPTQSEILRKASDAWQRRKLTPFVRRMFAWYFQRMR